MKTEKYRVAPGKKVKLSDFDPDELDGDKSAWKAHFAASSERLVELQELLYAEGKHKLLVVLQAIDAGGKDSTIRKVFGPMNPQGVKVATFKAPTEEELGHDYLWRVHARAPGRGNIAVFNRSHYEDVLIVRVKNLVPKAVWSKRYDHINDFERLLTDEGTTIVKIFLHISKKEQKERLQDRLDRPDKHWKFRKDDLAERARWDEYEDAFEAMLSKTSTDHAPWYVVPGNHKWARDAIIGRILVETLEGLDMQYPPAEEGLEGLEIPD